MQRQINRIFKQAKGMFKMTDMKKKLNDMELREIAAGSTVEELVKRYGPEIFKYINETIQNVKPSNTNIDDTRCPTVLLPKECQ